MPALAAQHGVIAVGLTLPREPLSSRVTNAGCSALGLCVCDT